MGASLSPREGVLEALARYCLALDARAFDDLRLVFGDECVLTLQDGTVAASGDAATELLATRVADAPRHRHLVTNVAVDVDGDRAHARSDWYLVEPADSPAWRIHSAGCYEDELSPTGDRWVFTKRTIRPAPR